MVTSNPIGWLLLVYKVPPEPTANRVAVWRKLKRLGAILLHDAVWVLPASPRTREELRWLASEIRDRCGEAMVWEGAPSLPGQGETLVEQFLAQVDTVYGEILAALESAALGAEIDLAALSRRYQQTRRQDYFNSALGRRVREALLAAGGRID